VPKNPSHPGRHSIERRGSGGHTYIGPAAISNFCLAGLAVGAVVLLGSSGALRTDHVATQVVANGSQDIHQNWEIGVPTFRLLSSKSGTWCDPIFETMSSINQTLWLHFVHRLVVETQARLGRAPCVATHPPQKVPRPAMRQYMRHKSATIHETWITPTSVRPKLEACVLEWKAVHVL